VAPPLCRGAAAVIEPVTEATWASIEKPFCDGSHEAAGFEG